MARFVNKTREDVLVRIDSDNPNRPPDWKAVGPGQKIDLPDKIGDIKVASGEFERVPETIESKAGEKTVETKVLKKK